MSGKGLQAYSDNLGEEIEKIETKYTEVKNWAQDVYDELSKLNAYRKFVRLLGETQPSYQQESEATQIQASQPPESVAQHSLVSSKSDFCLVLNNDIVSRQLAVMTFEASNREGTLPVTLKCDGVSTTWTRCVETAEEGHDSSVYGDKRNNQNWKAAFIACVDQAPAKAEYKITTVASMLCRRGTQRIENLRHSAAAYQAAMERLERKFGGQHRQVSL